MKRARNTPGPASYNIESGKFTDANMRREPMFKIGTAKRPDGTLLKYAKRLPGPGNYNTIEAA
jgi:Sperm-tail PG-rich repeat